MSVLMQESPRVPFAALEFAPAAVDVERRADGSFVLRSPQPLLPCPRAIGDVLESQARAIPDRIFLAERAKGGGWRRISYGETLDAVRRLAQALLDLGCTAERPLAILSGNSIDHALLTLAAMHVGVPAAPVSVAYSLMSQDFAKLRHVIETITPKVIFAEQSAGFAGPLRQLEAAGLLKGVTVVTGDGGAGTMPLAELLACRPGPAVDSAFAALTPDTMAKVLFTSGSTGLPKGVINTQRMLCANQQAMAQIYPFLARRPPVILDWLPWNHTFGGNHDFNMMLFHGGTLYIDEGKPAPGAIEQTVANLREVSPTIYFNVPRGFDMVVPYLEQDTALRDTFFRDLDLIFYAAAALPQTLWQRLEALSVAARGERVTMISAWGSTETAPCATAVHWPIEQAGVIGLPLPGTELLMTPNGSKLELRVRGPNVTPGYWRRPDLTREAFDEEGFYRIGDAGRFLDPAEPRRGIVFDGRVAEDFKLSTGTWVHVGALRVKAIAAASPLIQDCVVAGHDREAIALLVFPNPAALAALCPDIPAGSPLAALTAHPAVRQAIRDGLHRHNRDNPASSTRIARVLLLDSPPSIDANEITDKGYINQGAVLRHRADSVARLYAAEPDDGIMVL